MMSPESKAAVLTQGVDTNHTQRGYDIGPLGASGRTAHFMAGIGSASHYPGGPSRSSHSGGNEMSMREAQHFLTQPSDVFHSSIGGGMPGWDTSRAGMPVYG